MRKIKKRTTYSETSQTIANVSITWREQHDKCKHVTYQKDSKPFKIILKFILFVEIKNILQ